MTRALPLIIYLSLCVLGINAQSGAQLDVGFVYGKLISDNSQKIIEGATVQFLQNRLDSASRKKAEFVLAIVLTDKKGEFSIRNLPVNGNFKIIISAIGYESLEQKISFDVKLAGGKPADLRNIADDVVKDLGNIRLKEDPHQLQNVTVNANKPLLEMYLDKKVYNVEKDLSVTGGTAVDVMKNIPSLIVDIDGNVRLRNASPQIFVDGRPTTLSLDQIPADQIASVEIISNPSAKYDASGGGSGILNIVLKKNKKTGYNGNIRASIDSRGKPGLGADINVTQKKINFFAAGQFNARKSISTVRSERVDFSGADSILIKQDNRPVFNGYLAFGRAGADLLLTNRTTLSLSGNFFKGDFIVKDRINIFRDSLTATNKRSTSMRDLGADISFLNKGVSLGVKHNFARQGREYTADFNFNESSNDNISNYQSNGFDAQGNPLSAMGAERATGGGNTKTYTFQTDYTLPFENGSKFETGARIAARNYSSWNNNFLQDLSTGKYVLLPTTVVNFKFNDVVYAAYGNYSRQINKFSFQAGLRLERSSYDGNIVNKNQRFSNKYPASLFPSIFLSQKISEKESAQLNYSRKINRPSFYQILPFVDFSDSLNLAVGNPNLVPEFTNLAELIYSNNYKPGQSILASFYFQQSNNLITRYQYKAPNTNPAQTDSVIYNSFANANKSYTTGLELTGKNTVGKWWDITSNLNLYNAIVKAANIPGADNNSRFSWSAKLINNFKFAKKYSFQLSGDYQARTILPVNESGHRYGQNSNIAQGFILPIYGIDIALKRDFFKNNAASITLQFNDVFKTRTFETSTSTAFFTQENYRQRDPQVARLNFAWRFGKLDVALFKRKNIKAENENMQTIQGGLGQ